MLLVAESAEKQEMSAQDGKQSRTLLMASTNSEETQVDTWIWEERRLSARNSNSVTISL